MRNTQTLRAAAVLAAAAAAAGLTAPAARGQHSDVGVSVSGGRLVTGAHDHDTGATVPNARVFGYDFGEEPLDPYFAGDPGFDAPAGTLPAGSQLLFDVPGVAQAVLPRNLSYWNGSGAVAFTTVPNGESFRLNLGSQNLTITGTGTGPQAGFPIGTVPAGGSLHRHLNAFLNGSDGNHLPGDGGVPANGIYAFPVRLASSDPSILGSDPLYLVFNNGLTEAAHDRAIEHIETNVVPEPASAGLLAAATAGLLGRRRRRRSRTTRPG